MHLNKPRTLNRGIKFFICLAIGALLAACTGWLHPQAPEQLYLAMQIEDGGKIIAQPRLLGEAGRLLTLKLVEPNSPEQTKLALELFPERKNNEYHVQIKLALPDRDQEKSGELALVSGEERDLRLDNSERPLTVRLLLMRISSPEFDTFMKYSRPYIRNAS